jgi:DNA repair protein RecN (Recombination protein N)
LIEQLSVKNYVLFDSCIIDFNTGMSVITGETGAGKSLLIDAIGLLCGNRVVGNVVRSGKEKAILSMALTNNKILQKKLSEADIECEDEQVIITRIINANGKSSIRINQQITTLNFVKDIVSSQIDIHSQMDTYHLMDSNVQMELLDSYCKNEQIRGEVEKAYQEYIVVYNELENLKNEKFSDEELDFLTAQLNEIEEANVQEDELNELHEKISRSVSWQKNQEELLDCLYEIDRENGVLDSLYNLYKKTSKSKLLTEFESQIHDMYFNLQNIDEQIKNIKNQYGQDAENLDQLQDREYLIKRLYKKYGGSYTGLIEAKNNITKKIDSIIHRQDVFDKLEKKKSESFKNYMDLASELSKKRQSKFKELENAVEIHCKDLMLEKARFKIDCQECKPTISGIDKIDFLVSMNPGQDFSSLKTSASGGELSRLMLALKVVFQASNGIDTIIFDEIDTGVSGKVALSMGAKMKALSSQYQVLCITHLASDAVYADTHYVVKKTSTENDTITNINELSHDESISELAIMASGKNNESAYKSMEDLWEEIHG